MRTEQLPNNQEWLILAMESLEYTPDRNGICYGISPLGVQTFLSGEIERFNDRLYTIFDLFSTAASEAKIEIETNSDGINYATEEHRSHYISKLICVLKLKLKEKFGVLSKEEFYDIKAFFEDIELYYSSIKFPQYYPNDKFNTLINQSSEAILLTSCLIPSIPLENKGGLKHVGSFGDVFCHSYSINRLTDYLANLRLILKKYNEPVGLILLREQSHHCIALGYDPVQQQWLLLNANQLPILAFREDKEIAKAIISALSTPDEKPPLLNTDQFFGFYANIFISGQSEILLKNVIMDWIAQVNLLSACDKIKEANIFNNELFLALKDKALHAKQSSEIDQLICIYHILENRTNDLISFENKSNINVNSITKARNQIKKIYKIFIESETADICLELLKKELSLFDQIIENRQQPAQANASLFGLFSFYGSLKNMEIPQEERENYCLIQ